MIFHIIASLLNISISYLQMIFHEYVPCFEVLKLDYIICLHSLSMLNAAPLVFTFSNYIVALLLKRSISYLKMIFYEYVPCFEVLKLDYIICLLSLYLEWSSSCIYFFGIILCFARWAPIPPPPSPIFLLFSYLFQIGTSCVGLLHYPNPYSWPRGALSPL